eukprot:1171534-Lingulodinium_polyedra.AAC.1
MAVARRSARPRRRGVLLGRRRDAHPRALQLGRDLAAPVDVCAQRQLQICSARRRPAVASPELSAR